MSKRSSSENETTAALKAIFSSYASEPGSLSPQHLSTTSSFRAVQSQRAWSIESLKVENEDLKYYAAKLSEDVAYLEEELEAEKGKAFDRSNNAGEHRTVAPPSSLLLPTFLLPPPLPLPPN